MASIRRNYHHGFGRHYGFPLKGWSFGRQIPWRRTARARFPSQMYEPKSNIKISHRPGGNQSSENFIKTFSSYNRVNSPSSFTLNPSSTYLLYIIFILLPSNMYTDIKEPQPSVVETPTEPQLPDATTTKDPKGGVVVSYYRLTRRDAESFYVDVLRIYIN